MYASYDWYRLISKDGAGQQCCYDRNHYLMMSADQMWAGNPHRSHNFGLSPYDQAVKVKKCKVKYVDKLDLASYTRKCSMVNIFTYLVERSGNLYFNLSFIIHLY